MEGGSTVVLVPSAASVGVCSLPSDPFFDDEIPRPRVQTTAEVFFRFVRFWGAQVDLRRAHGLHTRETYRKARETYARTAGKVAHDAPELTPKHARETYPDPKPVARPPITELTYIHFKNLREPWGLGSSAMKGAAAARCLDPARQLAAGQGLGPLAVGFEVHLQ